MFRPYPQVQPDIDGDFIHIWLQLNQPHRAWTLLECWLKEAPEWAVHSFLEVMEFVLNADGLQATYDMYRKAIVSYGALLEHLIVSAGATMAALSTIRMHSWNCDTLHQLGSKILNTLHIYPSSWLNAADWMMRSMWLNWVALFAIDYRLRFLALSFILSSRLCARWANTWHNGTNWPLAWSESAEERTVEFA